MGPHSADGETEALWDWVSTLLASVQLGLKPESNSMLVNQLSEKRKEGWREGGREELKEEREVGGKKKKRKKKREKKALIIVFSSFFGVNTLTGLISSPLMIY